MKMSVYLQDLVSVSPRMEAAYDEAVEILGFVPDAVRSYSDREDWPTKSGVRNFVGGEFADHRDEKVQALVEILAETLTCPQYSAMAGLHCPYMGRLALASARARSAKAAAA